MATLNENIQTLQLFVLLLLLASLWKNPLGGRFTRQRQGGIFHRLLAGLCRSLVLAAAWWYEFVGGFSIEVSSYPTKIFWPRWPWLSRRVDNGVSYLVEFLLLRWLAWPIAENYLRAKWSAELEEASRQWRQL